MPVVLREAWSTLVPDLNDRHGPLPPLMLALTVVTGLVDAVSYLELGRVFVANMTGNVVFSGFAIAGAPGFSLVASLVALAAFAVGALLCGLIVHRTATHRGRMLLYALLVETTCALAALIVALVSGHPFDGGARFALISLLGLGLGVQNAVSRALAVPDLTTTVLTLTITGILSDSRFAGGGGSKAGRRVLSAAAMVTGAFVGALAALHGHPGLPLLLAVLILGFVTAAAIVLARADAPWARPIVRK
ncbi:MULTISPECIES: YoaK family protein [unclassified Streptomyces]|uniref:YoaK family protein n=1 Tax=unclassified Streptomyces TaxID=2593676 RepID=UPI0036E909EA